MWVKFLWLGIAGGLGTLARYGLGGLVQRVGGGGFPWGTLTVNVLGCFAAGLLWMLFENRISPSGQVRVIVLVGFMGGFTTFSSFMLETSLLMRDAEWLRAVGNLTLHNTVGMIALFLGLALGRYL